MFWDVEVTPEETDEIIEWTALELYKYGMETAAILFLESLKPISRYGSSMGQMFLGPLLPFFGDNITTKGEKAFRVFQEHENVEKLIQRLEYLATNGLEGEHKVKDESTSQEEDEAPKEEKKGWRKYLPF
jgi:hypothetical protein